MPQMVNLVNHFLIFSDTYLNTFYSLNQKIINQTNIVHVEVEKMNLTRHFSWCLDLTIICLIIASWTGLL